MKLMLRYLIFVVGLLLTGIGIAMTIKSDIGSTPMSIAPLVLSNVFPVSFGMMNFIWSLSFVFGQMILLGKGFTKDQYLQFLVCPLFGFFIDFGLFIFRDYVPYFYMEKLFILLFGCILLALGIYMQVMAKVIINPGEGIVRAIAYRARIKFGDAKIYFDIGVLTLGVVLSIILLGRVVGVGVGTLIIALGTGTVVKLFKWLFEHLDLERLYES
jgi:uncharacterized membrane protein YczE